MESENTHDFKYYFLKLFQAAEHLYIPLIAFFIPIKGIIITILAFIAVDTFTGIWKSKKKKIPITSKGLSAVVSKILLYEMAILITYCLDIFIVGEILQHLFSVKDLLTKVVALILVYIEAKSINENYREVKGVNFWHEFKALLSRTKELKEEISTFTKEDESK